MTAPPGEPEGFYGFSTDAMQPQSDVCGSTVSVLPAAGLTTVLPNPANTDCQGTPSGFSHQETFPPLAVNGIGSVWSGSGLKLGNHSPLYANTVVASISTRGRNIPFHIFIPRSETNGLEVDSYVKCEQVQTVSKARLLGAAWGRLTDDEMAQVGEALKLSLTLR